MPLLTDEQLLAGYAAGDRDALGSLAARYEGLLLGLASGLLGGSRSLAADAVQEMWVRVIKRAGAFQGRSTVKTWLYRILINVCHDLRRAAGGGNASTGHLPTGLDKRGSGDAAHEPASAPLGDSDQARELRAVLEAMPEPRRVVLLLCYHAGMRHEAAAEILGLPLGTLKSRLHAALNDARERLSIEVAP